MLPLPQLFDFIKSSLETQSFVDDQNKKMRVKRIDIINNDTLLCEFYPYANESMEIKLEIGPIMSFLASFWKDNPNVPEDIQNFAVKALTSQDEESIYAISPKHIAELMSEGRSIEWIKNTIFQDNSDDYRVTVAKRQISEIENALREVICDVLSNNHGAQWWNSCVERGIRNGAESAYENQTGATSSDGSVLISYTYLLGLKRTIADNWADFSHVFQNRSNFEAKVYLCLRLSSHLAVASPGLPGWPRLVRGTHVPVPSFFPYLGFSCSLNPHRNQKPLRIP